jgi:fructose-bisphosphate aldolase class I
MLHPFLLLSLYDNYKAMPTSSKFSFGGRFLTHEQKLALEETACTIATPGKGITACDEGPGTLGDRFEAVGIKNEEETRRIYRQMLFEAPGCEEYLCAAILDPETLYQKSDASGKLFPELLTDKGIVPGVKPHLKVGVHWRHCSLNTSTS